MEATYDGYIITDDLPPVPMSAIDYWSDDYDEEDDDEDEDDEYDYDKDGRRRWKKKTKNKGDDPSKAIDWHNLFPNFDYSKFDSKQGTMTTHENDGVIRHWPKQHSIKHARAVFRDLLGRWPGDHTEWAYVRNYADCDYYCERLQQSEILPGLIGVDVEMENDRKPFREWDSRWRTIRAHSRLAKGMFARLLQVANCDGLVVVFDLYALARPHSWEHGVEMDLKSRHWSSPKIPLPTSSLPPSLVRLILDPGTFRFGWALHCDWSSLYNSFGLLIPQKSYLDAQPTWINDLRSRVGGLGNGLADAARALFGIELDKSARGYGHFWHGMLPYGKIPNYMLRYAIRDGQMSLDVALQILLETTWLKNGGVWYSSNVSAVPLPGVRKRIYAWFGKPDEIIVERCLDFGKSMSFEPCASSSSDSGIGTEGSSGRCASSDEEIHGDTVEAATEGLYEHQESESDGLKVDETEDPEADEAEDDDEDPPRIVVSRNAHSKGPYKPKPFIRRTEDLYWKQLPQSIRDFIKKCKAEAIKTFTQLPCDRPGENAWSWCPAFTVFRGATRYKLKRLVQTLKVDESRYGLKEAQVLYQKARILCDNNLECAWRMVFQQKEEAPWEALKKFQHSVLDKSSFSRSQTGNPSRHVRGRRIDLLQDIAVSSLASLSAVMPG